MTTSDAFHPRFSAALVSLDPPWAVISPELVLQLRRYIVWIRSTFEPVLTPMDTFMLTALAIRTRLERDRLRRCAAADVTEMNACLNAALHAVASTDIEFARDAGVVPRLLYDVTSVQAYFDRRVQEWGAEANAIALGGLDGGEGLRTAREKLLFRIALETSAERLGEFAEFLGNIRTGSRLASRKRQEPRQARDDEAAELLSEFAEASAEAEGFGPLMMINSRGRLVPGAHQVRDHLPTRRVMPALSMDSCDEVNSFRIRVPDVRTSSPGQAAEDRDERAALETSLRKFVQARLPQEKKGSARYVVLSHLRELVLAGGAQASLARSSGLSEASVSKAVRQIGQAMLREPGIRSLLGQGAVVGGI